MVEVQKDVGGDIETYIGMAAFGLMALIFLTGISFLIYDFVNIEENSGPGESTIEELETNDMRISADRDSNFMVWRTSENNDFNEFRGTYQGGENIDNFGYGYFSMVEITDNYYNIDPEKSSRIVSTVTPDISKISEDINISLVEGSRVERVNGTYEVGLLDGEQDIEVVLDVEEEEFRLDEIVYDNGKISGLEGEEEIRIENVDGELVGHKVFKLEDSIRIEDEKTIELKVEKINSLQRMELRFNDVLTKANTSGTIQDPEGGLNPEFIEVKFN